ncbi:MAG: DUF45 domain-containing protein [Candidatus Buchananbacteria bacterium]|nr:DUF45 domain-containing protein [Candidatus Buchananbacteria bacterium]
MLKLTPKTLWEIVKEVNQKYFDNELSVKKIKWTKVSTLYYLYPCRYRLWAVCEPDTKTIYLNENIKKISHKMPRYVLTYLIFHECIHLLYLTHCLSFAKIEKNFPQFKKANQWLLDNDKRLITG